MNDTVLMMLTAACIVLQQERSVRGPREQTTISAIRDGVRSPQSFREARSFREPQHKSVVIHDNGLPLVPVDQVTIGTT